MKAHTSYPKNKIKILLLEGIHASATAVFKEHGYTSVENISSALSESEILRKIQDVHLVGIRSKTYLSKNIFEKAPRLISAGCYCIGTNQVAMGAAIDNGIAVFNSPYSNTRSVAEMVIAHCIYLLRKIIDKNAAAHRGEWRKDSTGSYEVRGKMLGIIGYGHIGSQVSVLAENMGMRVIFYDVVPRLALGNAQPVRNMDELLKTSDIVTLHVPGSISTKNLMNKSRLAAMKKEALLINLSRGDVVDLAELKDALQKKHLSGAAIDVFPFEPESNRAIFTSPLQGIPNVILTPHIGGSTAEAQEQIGVDVASKMIQFLETGSSTGSLSVPELSLPMQHQAHRLLHIHKNVPGVLSEINGLLSQMKVNILGQYLKTNESIGYVVLDIDKKTSPKVISELKNIKHTVKVRSLY